MARYQNVREALEEALLECQRNTNGREPDEVAGCEVRTAVVQGSKPMPIFSVDAGVMRSSPD